MSREREFFETIASRNLPRITVRAIVLSSGQTLVQKPTDDPTACYAFIGGEYEVGDSFEGRLRREFEEETTGRMVSCEYLFVVETQFVVYDKLIHCVEHFCAVTLDRERIESREGHLSQHWLPVFGLKAYDLRPWVVRDVIANGLLHSVRHLVDLPEGKV